jgi:predicted MFS family arabinose efflux permease
MAMTARLARDHSFTKAAAVASVGAMIALMFMGSTLLTPLYSIYRDAFGFSQVVLTLIYSAYVIGNLAALLFFGRVSDQIGRRPVTLISIALAIVATLLFLLATATAWLFAARILSGFAIGLGSGAGAAWIAELDPRHDRGRAALQTTSANFAGLAVGPLVSGLLAQYAPWPLRLPYAVQLAALLLVGIFIWATPETVGAPQQQLADVRLRPRLGVPRAILDKFMAPAITVFGTMALIGFYAALLPSLLAERLHQTNHAVGGTVVFWLFAVAVAGVILTRRLQSRTAMLAGLGLLLPSLALLVLAQLIRSMPVLLLGTTVAGVASALGYRGGLQVVNVISPEDRRAEMVSSYYVAGFVGNSLPVVGVGVLSGALGSIAAGAIFAITIGAFAVIALVVGTRGSATQLSARH